MVSTARYYQRAKNGIHALQGLLIFIGAAITIAVFTKGGKNDGRIIYYFILCWLCIPALIYQTAFPTFERTKRFANPYAHALIDIIYTILWFSAFIALIVWAKQGSHAAKDWDGKKDKVCDKFDWGPASKCKLGQATGALAVLIWLLFALTTTFSIYGVSYYRANGSMPASTTKASEAIPAEDQDGDYIFSSNTHGELDQQQQMQSMHRDEDEVSSLHPTDPGAASQEGERMSWLRPPTPDLPMDWDRRSTPDVGMGEGWNRRRTPDLPVGENYYPVDTSYHGGRQSPYDPPQPPQHLPSGSSDGRSSSPHYDTYHSNESDFVGGLKPRPVQMPRPLQSRAGEAFGDDLELSHDSNNRLDFPDADYGRLGH